MTVNKEIKIKNLKNDYLRTKPLIEATMSGIFILFKLLHSKKLHYQLKSQYLEL